MKTGYKAGVAGNDVRLFECIQLDTTCICCSTKEKDEVKNKIQSSSIHDMLQECRCTVQRKAALYVAILLVHVAMLFQ